MKSTAKGLSDGDVERSPGKVAKQLPVGEAVAEPQARTSDLPKTSFQYIARQSQKANGSLVAYPSDDSSLCFQIAAGERSNRWFVSSFNKVISMSHAKQVSLDTFESEVLESSVPVVVDFYADWCAPCRMLGPVLDRVSRTFDGRAKIVKVNVDHEPALARQFNVASIPTLAFVLHGEVIGQSAGLPSESDLNAVVQQLVAMN